jgi:hypothetical protein
MNGACLEEDIAQEIDDFVQSVPIARTAARPGPRASQIEPLRKTGPAGECSICVASCVTRCRLASSSPSSPDGIEYHTGLRVHEVAEFSFQ